VTSYANVCFKVSSPRVRAKSDGVGTNQAKGMPMRWELVFANERSIESADFPARKEPRPQIIPGPLHIQCNGYGDSGYIKQLVDQVLTWPHIEPSPTSVSPPDTIRIRLADIATDKPSAFLTPREFGRVLVRVPTIYLALPLVCAHWAIVSGWTDVEVVDPSTGAPVDVGQPGEIVARGANVMLGYWNHPECTARAFRNSFFRTGDIGYQDAVGNLFIVDSPEGHDRHWPTEGLLRAYCDEVEAVIYQLATIREAALFGMPDPNGGELVAACVVLQPGVSPSEQELLRHCRKSLTDFKVPRQVEFRKTNLPRPPPVTCRSERFASISGLVATRLWNERESFARSFEMVWALMLIIPIATSSSK
jgi:acyl-CoA synthetase (AMP-forming)/AMP-acid ligase II